MFVFCLFLQHLLLFIIMKAPVMKPTPRLVISSQSKFSGPVSHPVYSFVCHSNISRITLSLPVMPTGQALFTTWRQSNLSGLSGYDCFSITYVAFLFSSLKIKFTPAVFGLSVRSQASATTTEETITAVLCECGSWSLIVSVKLCIIKFEIHYILVKPHNVMAVE